MTIPTPDDAAQVWDDNEPPYRENWRDRARRAREAKTETDEQEEEK